MSNLDPLSITIIAKAVDFLFDQAGKTLQKLQRNKDVSTVKSIPSSADDTSSYKSDIVAAVSKEINIEELQHCLNQIHRYTKNVHAWETRIASFGGETLAPIDIVNNLDASQQELQKWIRKLKSLLEKASNREFPISGLD